MSKTKTNTYQVNVRTDLGLEHLSVYAPNETKAIVLADQCYKGYVREKFIRTYKIISVFNAN